VFSKYVCIKLTYKTPVTQFVFTNKATTAFFFQKTDRKEFALTFHVIIYFLIQWKFLPAAL